jgi:cellulose biosynthesis protein BcsQ
MSEGNVVTFYSYKGGVGRTLALANIGALLSLWGYKVLCVDWDLEAPGLHLYYKPWTEQVNSPGLSELIQAHADGEKPYWKEFVTKVNFPDAKEPLLLMTAGLQDKSYVGRMQALDWQMLYEERNLGNFLEELRHNWKQEFDFVLIDSRTGITDIGGICTVQLPDLLVILFTANFQSLFGAIDVVNRAIDIRNELPFDRAKLLVLPIATRFEARFEYEIAQEWLAIFAKELEPFHNQWADKKVKALDLLNFTKVPYVPYWSFGEKVPVVEEGTKDPESIGFAFETLAAMIAHQLSKSNVLVSDRDSFVTTAKRGLVPGMISLTNQALDNQSRGACIFLSYSSADIQLRDELVLHLLTLQRQGLIQAWHERQILAGEEWQKEIDLHIEEADIILLLISADYIACDYPYGIEVRRALERHANGTACVIPVILRPVDWQSVPFSKLQALPKNAKPVTSWSNREEAFLSVAQGIRAVVRQLAENSSRVNPFDYGTPVPPERFYGRHRVIADVKNRIGAISAQCINIVGLQGSGKTSLFRYIQERSEVFCQREQKPLIVTLDLQDKKFHTPEGILEGLRRGITKLTGTEPWLRNDNDDPFEVEDGLQALCDRGYRLIVMLDEFERIGARLEEFQDWGEDWRAKASAGLLTMVIASIRPLGEIYNPLGLTSPFGNIFSTTILGSLEEDTWQQLIRDGFSQGGKGEALPEILQWIDGLAGGLPFYTQMAASLLWQYGDCTQAQSEFIFQAAKHFRKLWHNLTLSECQILKNIVNGVSGSLQSTAVVDTLKRHGVLRSNGRLFSSAFAEFVSSQQ